jgi:hypothetical protein
MNSEFKTIEHFEIDDFKKIVTKHGHDPNTYELIESQVKDLPAGWHAKVTVKRGSTERTYESGIGSKWPCGEFIRDLENDVF